MTAPARTGPGWDALRHHRWDGARKALAPLAEQGDPGACLGLGLLCWTGRGTPRSRRDALALFQRAAQTGAPDALTAHAAAVQDEDRAGALALLRRAADAGFAPAMTRLAAFPETADEMAWLRRAAEAGSPDAMAMLGRKLAATPARVEALSWLYAAASLGADEHAAKDARALARLMVARDISSGQNKGRALVKQFKAKASVPTKG